MSKSNKVFPTSYNSDMLKKKVGEMTFFSQEIDQLLMTMDEKEISEDELINILIGLKNMHENKLTTIKNVISAMESRE
jgi:hypothetical protein